MALATAARIIQGESDEMPLWIRGREAAGTYRERSVAPATGATLAMVHLGGREDVEGAIRDAQGAQESWAELGARERAARIDALAARLLENIDTFAMLDALDTGSPITSMRADVEKGASFLRLCAGVALEMKGRTIPSSPTGWHLTFPRPWGVVGAITAYNHPTLFACLKSAPALIAGNSVVMKPSELAPLSPVAFAALTDGLLPPGVLSAVPGAAEAGTALVSSPLVQRITFTGSLATGLAVQRAAADSGTIKSLTLELGGKNPIIVYPDAPVAEAAAAVVKGMNLTRVQGQSCGSTSRLLVHESIHDDLMDRVISLVSEIKLGLPQDEDTEMGSLISRQHRDRIVDTIARAYDEGIEPVFGGAPPVRQDLAAGAFLTPTLFDRVDPRAEIASEEVFGPVLAVTTWYDEESAIAVGNATKYGLSASIWTRDIDRAISTAERIDAGYIWINDVETRYPGVPFGGWKQSGIGFEQALSDELLSFTRNKSVNIGVSHRRPTLA